MVYRYKELQLLAARMVSSLPHNTEHVCDTHMNYYKAGAVFLQSLCGVFAELFLNLLHRQGESVDAYFTPCSWFLTESCLPWRGNRPCHGKVSLV